MSVFSSRTFRRNTRPEDEQHNIHAQNVGKKPLQWFSCSAHAKCEGSIVTSARVLSGDVVDLYGREVDPDKRTQWVPNYLFLCGCQHGVSRRRDQTDTLAGRKWPQVSKRWEQADLFADAHVHLLYDQKLCQAPCPGPLARATECPCWRYLC